MKTIKKNTEYTMFWVDEKDKGRGYSKIQWTGGYLKHPTKNIILLDFVNLRDANKKYTVDNAYFKKNAIETTTLDCPDEEMPI